MTAQVEAAGIGRKDIEHAPPERRVRSAARSAASARSGRALSRHRPRHVEPGSQHGRQGVGPRLRRGEGAWASGTGRSIPSTSSPECGGCGAGPGRESAGPRDRGMWRSEGAEIDHLPSDVSEPNSRPTTAALHDQLRVRLAGLIHLQPPRCGRVPAELGRREVGHVDHEMGLHGPPGGRCWMCR